MPRSISWGDYDRQILDLLDIESAYRALGIQFTSSRPTGSGWLACWAIDRPHGNNPSAAVNVGNGEQRGRYRDLGGIGESLNLWEFAAKYGQFNNDWRAARKHYAEQANVPSPRGAEPTGPADRLDFYAWCNGTIENWVTSKGQVSAEAARLCGARMAMYPKRCHPNHIQNVLAFPVFPVPGLTESEPCGWVITDLRNIGIRHRHGPNQPEVLHKTLSVKGSRGGLMNQFALQPQRFAAAEIIWKVEGLSDMICLQSMIPLDQRERHLVITNSQGASENVRQEWIELLIGRHVVIVGDADRPGQVGANKWIEALAGIARTVRNVQLPYSIEESHGKDLRDFFKDGNQFDDLQRLAARADVIWGMKAVPAAPAAPAAADATSGAVTNPVTNLENPAAVAAVGSDQPGQSGTSSVETTGNGGDLEITVDLSSVTSGSVGDASEAAPAESGASPDSTPAAGDAGQQPPPALPPAPGGAGASGEEPQYSSGGWIPNGLPETARPTSSQMQDPFNGRVPDVNADTNANGHANGSSNGHANGNANGNGAAGAVPQTVLIAQALARSTVANYRSVLDLLELDVLGDYQDGSVEVFSRRRRKTNRITNVGRLSYAELVRICGDPAVSYVHDSRENIPNRFSIVTTREAIAYAGGDLSLSDRTAVGKGIWMVDNKPTLVNGNTAATYENGSLNEIVTPRVGETILDFSHQERWINFTDLHSNISHANDRAWCLDAIAELKTLLSNWFWRHDEDTSLVASLICCSWVQTLWPWRPLVAVTGASDSGKSFLFTAIRDIFGLLAAYIQKPSEAGIRQLVKNQACVLLVDEFESDHNRQKVLELFRLTSQGGEVVRGTADQRGKRFTMRHIPWVASIESGLNREADKNRFIRFNLGSLGDVRGKMKTPDANVLADLGKRLLAISLVHFDRAKELFFHLKGMSFDGIHGRTVESFSVPAAMYATIHGLDRDGAEGVLSSFLDGRNTARIESDEEELIRIILESKIRVGNGIEKTVSEICHEPKHYCVYYEALERDGIALIEDRNGPRSTDLSRKTHVFLNITAVKRYLLRRTRFEEMDCDVLLERFGGVQKQRVVSGKRSWGWEFPIGKMITIRSDNSEAEAMEFNRTCETLEVALPVSVIDEASDSIGDSVEPPKVSESDLEFPFGTDGPPS